MIGIKKIVLFFLVFPNLLLSIDSYMLGDSLIIIAESGLNIRSIPNVTGDIVGVVGYKEQVVVLENKISNFNFNPKNDSILLFDEIEDKYFNRKSKKYWLKGRWVKIDYKGIKGYVFDGFLSNNWDFSNVSNGYIEGIGSYINRSSKLIKHEEKNFTEPYEAKKVKMIYQSGNIIVNEYDDKAGGSSYYLNNCSEEDIMIYYSYYIEKGQSGDSTLRLSKSDSKNRIYHFESENRLVIIEIIGEIVCITETSWC